VDVPCTSVVDSLKKVAKASVIVFIGAVFYYLARFLFRTILARGLSAGDYGTITISMALADTVAVVSLLGIPAVLTRQIASARSRGENPQKFATAGILVVLLTSVTTSMFLYSVSDILSGVLNASQDVLQVFAIYVLFTALLWVATAVAQGYEDVSVLVYVQHILYGFLLVVSAVIGGLFFQYTRFAALLCLISVAIASIVAIIYLLRKGYLRLGGPAFDTVYYLLVLSIPLFLSSVVSVVFGKIDIFMLGHFLGSTAVGMYNVALTVVNLLPLFLFVANYLYLPIASSMVASGSIGSLRRFYQVLTKWIVVFTLPLFAVIVLYPHIVVSLFFGQKYVAAATSLFVLALAHLVNTCFGVNSWTLVALGEARFVFFYTLASAAINFFLNAILIPVYGIEGAALATATSILFVSFATSAYLVKKYGVHPFTRQYFSSFLAAFVPLFVFKLLDVSVGGLLNLFVLLFIYFLVYCTLLLVLRVFEKEDVEILRSIERRTGANLGIVWSILRKFS